jgi:3-hydroxyacyl-CoA dehydrogenase / enoyl-CoA hydratase / 3-hydroxybutyryl-CoA epimerase / enoyl-CoA isomerase
MNYQGQAIQSSMLESGIVELQFNLKDDVVNKFNSLTLKELREAVDAIKRAPGVTGLLVTSGKDSFIVGADITEFLQHFKRSEEELAAWLMEVNQIFSDLEDLPFPTVTAINGFALGGGFEFALSTTFRVMASNTKVGLPETKLGIYPGWGGTVRLSRLTGADNAIEWIASGNQWDAETALNVGAVDAVVSPEKLRESALSLLKDAIAGKLNWQKRVEEKTSSLKLNQTEAMMTFETAKGFIAAKAGPHYPAPVASISAMEKGAGLTRDEALPIEAKGFAKVAKTSTAYSLVSLFLGDQYLKKISKKTAKGAQPVKSSAVLGAGIMGGGVAYQSASRGTPIYMKDIRSEALDLGMREASGLLEKQMTRGKITAAQMGETLSQIRPTLSYGDFKEVDLVVEAVVENEKVKKAVLAEVEQAVQEGTILTSNTSTISITRLAEGLKRPEDFCGMHFFNPVHRMPLVEIIRGKKTSEKAIATTVAYALAMGKTPIVVNDCPGFLVNRVLFPYFAGFIKLIQDGVDFQRIDRVMEKFGWPMGPAYLLDVVGIDTAEHANAVMGEEFPDRMKHDGKTAISAMFEANRFGQKNGKGFYLYTKDKKGGPQKVSDPESYEILKPAIQSQKNDSVTDEEIIDRMMLPMIIECSRCLEEDIIQTPTEVDMGLIYGLGFPPFRGGALRYADHVGLNPLAEKAQRLRVHGKLYELTEQMKRFVAEGRGFYEVN